MRSAHFLAIALAALTGCSDGPTSPRARVNTDDRARLATDATTTSDVFPVTIQQFVPCANGGAGEVVEVSGNLHQVLTTVLTESGRIVVRSHFQPQGLSGVGLTTGDKYQATGVTQETASFSPPFPVTATFINNFRFIGAGPDNNLLVHQEAHVTIDANGNVRVDVDKLSVECR
jgi:hypothetical protein